MLDFIFSPIRSSKLLRVKSSPQSVVLQFVFAALLRLQQISMQMLQGGIPGAPTVDPSSLPVSERECEHPSASSA